MLKKAFSGLSILFLLLTFSPLMAGSFSWGDKFFELLLGVSMYLPFVFGALGLLFAFLGAKGQIKLALILLNMLALVMYGLLFMMAVYGFREP